MQFTERMLVVGLIATTYSPGFVWCLPRTCHEVQAAGGRDGLHDLDPDQEGLNTMAVFCNVSGPVATAVLHHNLEAWIHVTGFEGVGSYNGELLYDNNADVESVRQLILTSSQCSYYVDLQCMDIRAIYIYWTSYYGRENVWEKMGGNFCERENGTRECRCGLNSYSLMIDQGHAGNWPLFPLVALRFGDTGGSIEYLDFRVGPLVCEQGRIFRRHFRRQAGKRQTAAAVEIAGVTSKVDCARACSDHSLLCLGFNFRRGPPVGCELSHVITDAATSVLLDEPQWDYYMVNP